MFTLTWGTIGRKPPNQAHKQSKIGDPGSRVPTQEKKNFQNESEKKFQGKGWAIGPEHRDSRLEQEVEVSRMNACKKSLTTCKFILWRVFSELLKGIGRDK